MTAAGAGASLQVRSETSASRPGWRLVVGFAGATILIHFLTNGGYGYFRDELYFIACGEHLAAGYVDLPPMVALIAKLSRATMGDSLFAIRFSPALAGGATVAIAGLLAWELGGGFFAQALAMLAALTVPVYLALGNMLTMNAFDPIFWMGCAWALIRMIKSGDLRWWLVFGLSAGLGLENKESIVFLGAALLIGLALTPQRRLLTTRWLWPGGMVALAIALPTVIWQLAHQMPMYEELSNVKGGSKNTPLTLFSFFGGQMLLMSPLTLPIWLSGLYFFLLSERGRELRAIGWAYVVVYGAFVVLKGKVYYIAPFYPVLLAPGAVQLESVSYAFWRPAVRYALPSIVAIGGIVFAPMTLPILPVETFIRYQRALGFAQVRTETRELADLPQTFADMFGWPEMVATIARVYWSLPPEERKEAAIYARNYGEAAAIDFFGPRYGLPKSISGHMAYYLWGPGDSSGKVLITVGSREEGLKRAYAKVEKVAMVGTRYSMPDEHVPVFLCRESTLPIQQMWPLTKVYQ
ncbi:MAG: glycosyltransferase family 39 protein [Candidatus Binatus sp.]|uniref:glycosyltransferase family 39 protein n=1 Tax=Candidatus Binatus sp. TaxID=2811406 RepID=UPI00271D9B5E|nr:glycosyltransferase family 39 protein [Candidatus Binatus sp.]MDO8430819.1 glycosyltransferase family 39 protein [Candidatus Binatus sp.]